MKLFDDMFRIIKCGDKRVFQYRPIVETFTPIMSSGGGQGGISTPQGSFSYSLSSHWLDVPVVDIELKESNF